MSPDRGASGDGVACCLCGDSMIVHGGPVSAKVWVWSAQSTQWSEIVGRGPAPPPRRHHSITHIGDGRLVVFGGQPLGPADPHSPPCWQLSLITKQWELLRTVGDAPCPRYLHAATSTASGPLLLICGGQPLVPTEGAEDLYILPITTGRWTRVKTPSGAPHPLAWGLTLSEWRGTVLLYGGRRRDGGEMHRSVLLWNVSTGEWSQSLSSTAPPARAMHAAAVSDGELVVFGGRTEDGRVAADCWVWSVAADAWRSVELPAAVLPLAAAQRPLAVAWNRCLVTCCPSTAQCMSSPIAPAAVVRAAPPQPPPERQSAAPSTIVSPHRDPEMLQRQLSELESQVAELVSARGQAQQQPPAPPQPAAARAVDAVAADVGAMKEVVSEMSLFLAHQRRREEEQEARVESVRREMLALQEAWAEQLKGLTVQMAELREQQQRPSASEAAMQTIVSGVGMLADAVAELQARSLELPPQQPDRAMHSSTPLQPPPAAPAARYPLAEHSSPPNSANQNALEAHLRSLSAQLTAIETDAA
eukprot:TRINITY_DN11374_c0_g1_i3.p1 TRINITY_DN11374_c0_g1~~TRINITY_DN11374_c0_g1_i3.p1  ORF type:complete len:531 (+),score=136.64 TRINITY_DN11374_c0_g1_i3:88-1680(+)